MSCTEHRSESSPCFCLQTRICFILPTWFLKVFFFCFLVDKLDDPFVDGRSYRKSSVHNTKKRGAHFMSMPHCTQCFLSDNREKHEAFFIKYRPLKTADPPGGWCWSGREREKVKWEKIDNLSWIFWNNIKKFRSEIRVAQQLIWKTKWHDSNDIKSDIS